MFGFEDVYNFFFGSVMSIPVLRADPVTALLLASTALSTYGVIQQGEAQAAQAESAAQANEYNATVQRNNAQVAQAAAARREEEQRSQFGQLQGAARVAVAQSGAGMGGSNLEVLKRNALQNELDALTIRYEGQSQARGLIAQSQLEQQQAAANRSAGSAARTGAYISAGANLLQGGATAYKNMPTKTPTKVA